MDELQQVIEKAAAQIAGAQQAASYTVVLTVGDAQRLVDTAQLAGPLRERCELLGRALNAVWCLVSEDDQKSITELLDGKRRQVKY